MKSGKLFIISGPSQIGKDVIVRKLQLDRSLKLTHVITNTTRRKRPGERHRVYINFLTETEFQKLINNSELLEWAIPYVGQGARYGTPKKPVMEMLNKGHNVMLNIDTQGALQVKTKLPKTTLIFITAESAQEVKRRIFASTKMTLKQKQDRWLQAIHELKVKDKYDYIVINNWGKLNETIKEVKNIIKKEISQNSYLPPACR